MSKQEKAMLQYVASLGGEISILKTISRTRKNGAERHPLVGEIENADDRKMLVKLTWNADSAYECQIVANYFSKCIGDLMNQTVNHTTDKFMNWKDVNHGTVINFTASDITPKEKGEKSQKTKAAVSRDLKTQQLTEQMQSGDITLEEFSERMVELHSSNQ